MAIQTIFDGITAGHMVAGALAIASVIGSVTAVVLAIDKVLDLLRAGERERAYLALPQHMRGRRLTRSGTVPIYVRGSRRRRRY